MALLDRIANYFKEWDGIDETAPKMELSIHELRYIANLNIERCRLIRQVNEANLKTEALLLDKTQENRNKTINEFVEKANKKITEFILQHQEQLTFVSGVSMGWTIIDDVAGQMKESDLNESRSRR